MKEAPRLLFGPYEPPRVKRGEYLEDIRHGLTKVGGYSSGRIQWPVKWKTGRGSLILCGDLIRAVRTESSSAVAYWFGVSITTVWYWRKALGVGRMTEGTKQVYRDVMPQRLSDESTARGRAKAATPEIRAKMAATKAGRTFDPDERRDMWTADEDALIKQRVPDREVARLTGRSLMAVRQRRTKTHHMRAPYHKSANEWPDEHREMLGSMPDGVLADLLERTREAVKSVRISHHIPPVRHRVRIGTAFLAEHLWVVLTTPVDGQVLTASITTLRGDSDRTVLVEPEDMPTFVSHRSCISYRHTRLASLAGIYLLLRDEQVRAMPRASDELVTRIRRGLYESPFLLSSVRQWLKANPINVKRIWRH